MTNEELATRIKNGERELIPALWGQIERYVKKLANRMIYILPFSAGVEFDDLVQSGFLAMMDALKYFDETQGAFTTVLSMTLKSAFAEAAGYRTIRQRNDPLRQPSTTSLDAPVSAEDAEGASLLDIVSDERDEIASTEERIFQEQLHQALDEVMSQLAAEQAEVIRKRYYENQTLQQISDVDGRSLSMIRQIERAAIGQMRKPKHSRVLNKFMLELRTPYFLKVGPERFQSTHTSAVEEIVFYREQIINRMQA